MATCENILKGLSAFDCNTPFGGTTGKVILINYDDIDRTALSIAEGNVTALALKTGKKGVVFEGAGNNANIGSFSFSQGTYGGGTYIHTLELRDFKGGADAYNFLEGLKQNNVVAIVETKYKGDDNKSAFTIYGLETGMRLSAHEGTTEFSDGVISTFTLASDENSPEPMPPINLLKTDYTTTQTLINSLIAVAE